MLKKFFRRLTQSREERYQESLNQLAVSLDPSSPQLARTVRELAKLKHELDSRLAARDASMLEIDDLEQLAENVCDGVQAQIKELAQLDQRLSTVLAARDADKFNRHMDSWRQGNAAVFRAFDMLSHVATGDESSNAELISNRGANTTLIEAMETLDLQVRTAARIKNELGG